MKITKKVISLISFLFLTSLSNPIDSLEEDNINFQPNTLISNAIEEKEIKTVTSNGFGTSLESAAQNAAENALTNVVGSFLDAKTILKEKTKISDGILSETSIIKENINDYSQGTIKYFEILDIQQNGSIFNVTARVDVRIDDFRNYIKQLALQTKEISTTNLFAEMGSKTANLDNKYELLEKIIFPVKDGEVIHIAIGDLQTAESFLNSKNCLAEFSEEICDPSNSILHNFFNIEKTVFFPFSLNLKKDFIENSLNILENISDKKTSSITSIFGKDEFSTLAKIDNKYDFYKSQDIAVIIRDHQKQTISNYYILEGLWKRLKNETKKGIWDHKSKLRISLVDSMGQTIYSFKERCGDRFEGELKNIIFENNVAKRKRGFQKGYIGELSGCPSRLYYRGINSSKFDLTSARWFGFAFEINNLEILKDFKEIKIEYLQN